jgi:hypothetical protein
MKTLSLIFVLTLALACFSCGGKVSVNNSNAGANRPANATSPASTNSNAAASSTTNNSSAPVTVTGKWEMVGKEGDWKDTVDMVGMDGFLWSVEADGSLYKTDPATGNFAQVGDKGSFQKLKHLEAMDHMLWTVEGDTLYKSDPATGKWERMGEGGGWGKTVAMASLNGILYSVEPDGSLWKTDKSGNDTLIDKGDFKGCTDLAALDGRLWTLENGMLYSTEPNTLKWQEVGEFKNISVMISGTDFLWMLDNSGTLLKVDRNGTSTVIGESGGYGQTTVLTTLNGKLWTVEHGNLYKTS